MAGYKEVLVAVDLSDDLIEVLKAAVEKVARGANVSIVHVLEPAYYYYGMEPALGTLPPSFEEDLLKRATTQLEAVGRKYGVADRAPVSRTRSRADADSATRAGQRRRSDHRRQPRPARLAAVARFHRERRTARRAVRRVGRSCDGACMTDAT